MTVANIVRSANQIAEYFRSYPREMAVRETSVHIRSFWEPRLRRQLLDHIDAGGAGLDDIVVDAARLLPAAD